MPIRFDLEEKDPLDLIVNNKRFVKHLRQKGIDGFKINKILHDLQGYKFQMPLLVTKREAAKNKKINYAMRRVKALISTEATTDGEKKYLCKMYNRLWDEYIHLEKDKSGKPVIKLKQGKGNAKTHRQATGRQVVKLYNYILPFSLHSAQQQKKYNKTDIRKLIAELFEVVRKESFAEDQIKYFYKNNK
jgi:hypothetical protein